jgi:hypothetical protein
MSTKSDNTISMPKAVFEAAEVLINSFFEVDYDDRLQFFREEDPQFAVEFEAAAERYEKWRTAVGRAA